MEKLKVVHSPMSKRIIVACYGLRARTQIINADHTHGPEPRTQNPEPRGVFQHPVSALAHSHLDSELKACELFHAL